ncbi:hypothetical protein GG804_12835 [Sphingomonas histidinilytica]|uniref:hypothetical protein n=1 Tax=Rhizorhabdus histidinilytica TaxID=439228 RepID=UPI001ADA5A00|nr:hypothetical protein [Rhizorhabdus histidinilytica]MBO9377655.1 hypothetical protein [Rhizorhabdus histidinilytica]
MSRPGPIERAARALCEMDGNPPGATMDGKPLWQDYVPEVRAVLTAIREPSETMLAANPAAPTVLIYPEDIWGAMVDAALAEGA